MLLVSTSQSVEVVAPSGSEVAGATRGGEPSAAQRAVGAPEASGQTAAQGWLARFDHEWQGSVLPIFGAARI